VNWAIAAFLSAIGGAGVLGWQWLRARERNLDAIASGPAPNPAQSARDEMRAHRLELHARESRDASEKRVLTAADRDAFLGRTDDDPKDAA
jgi:hypothetical protein